jgi:DNA-binding LacI/PurR family transcriptional regulator
MPDHKQRARQRRYEKGLREHGLKRKVVWVPEAAEAEFWRAVDRLRRKWRADGLLPERDDRD